MTYQMVRKGIVKILFEFSSNLKLGVKNRSEQSQGWQSNVQARTSTI